jgi:dTDP-4-dehydrorhamnose reductase
VACAVYELLGARGALGDGAGVVPVPTSEVVRPAPRPVMGVLDCHATWRALGFAPPHWRVGVAATVDELLDELLRERLEGAGDTAPRGGAHG